MGDPYYFNKNGVAVYGIATGQYLLCGGDYKWAEWSGYFQAGKVDPEPFWWLGTKTRYQLVASEVDGENCLPSEDRGLLPVLNEQQQTALQDGLVVVPNNAPHSMASKTKWPTGKRPPSTWEDKTSKPATAKKHLDPNDSALQWTPHGHPSMRFRSEEEEEEPEEQLIDVEAEEYEDYDDGQGYDQDYQSDQQVLDFNAQLHQAAAEGVGLKQCTSEPLLKKARL
jgi:hypothetical protein